MIFQIIRDRRIINLYSMIKINDRISEYKIRVLLHFFLKYINN